MSSYCAVNPKAPSCTTPAPIGGGGGSSKDTGWIGGVAAAGVVVVCIIVYFCWKQGYCALFCSDTSASHGDDGAPVLRHPGDDRSRVQHRDDGIKVRDVWHAGETLHSIGSSLMSFR